MANKPLGPGPCHILPSTVGFERHDYTMCRAPAFSFGSRTELPGKKKWLSPAPNTYNPVHISRYGLITSQTNSLGPKIPRNFQTCTPGPNTYNPKVESKAPAFSILSQSNLKIGNKSVPGANAYVLPSSIGTNIPDKRSGLAFSVLSRNFPPIDKTPSPGPKYMLPNLNVYKKSPPSISLKDKLPIKDLFLRPGPNKYNPEFKEYKASPMYSFGVKRYPYLRECYLPEDLEE